MRRYLPLILTLVGGAILLSTWGGVADWTEAVLRQESVRPRQVVFWTSSGSPEVEIKMAQDFMALHPDIRVTPNFRETGGLQDMLYLSFLSGNPPDFMTAPENELRNYVLMGGVLPLNPLLEQEGPEYFDQYLFGQARVYRLNVYPNDRFFTRDEQGRFRYPLEAARLLTMNGQAIGLRGVSMPDTLTYNKRLFREAARMFPEAGLVDEHGEPIPPATWTEFYHAARVLTEYGRREAERRGLADPVCYGLVVQGQRMNDITRGIWPLARRAGSNAFRFEGDTETVHRHLSPEAREAMADRPIGFFDYDNPADLAAFALMLKMKQDGFVLPGTEARHYEDVRTALASGRAAMVLDGWHAALIGAERVPWAAQDLGSASIPHPYRAADPEAGVTPAQSEAEWAALDELLGLSDLGIELPPGNPLPRTPGGVMEFITPLARDPEAVWEWMHFGARNEEVLRTQARRGTIPQERTALERIEDRDWFPFPYQRQVYRIMRDETMMWPEKPVHGSLAPSHAMEVFYEYFHGERGEPVTELVARARERIAAFNEAANRDLARRIEDGIEEPTRWTFPDWDPLEAGRFFELQQGAGASPEAQAELDRIEEELLRDIQERPELEVAGPDGGIRDDIWRYDPPHDRLAVLFVPGLILLTALGWVAFQGVRSARGQGPSLPAIARQARAGWVGYLFVLPAVILLYSFIIYPAFYQISLAMHRGDGLVAMQYVGFDNFRRILVPGTPDFDSIFWTRVVPNTFVYMLGVTLGQLVFGFILASLLNLPMAANKVYRVFFIIPLATSLAIVSVILIGLLRGQESGLNQFLSAVGLQDLPVWLGLARPGETIDWLGERTGLATVMAVGLWHGLPYTIILLLAGLQSISPALFEAAKVDGANPWQRFIHVTLPEMKPILIIIAFNSLIGAARAFSVVFVMTEGGIRHSSELVATYIFKKGFQKPPGIEPDLGYASALGIVYAAMLAALTFTNVFIIARRWRRRLAAERAAGGQAPAAPEVVHA